MTTNGKGTNFWTTLPGIITGIAGLITAISGLLLVLYQTGVMGGQDEPITATDGTTATAGSTSEPTLGGEGDAIAGTWRGTAESPDGSNPFTIELEVAEPCQLNMPCGTIHVSSVPCTGRVTLVGVESETYEFDVDQFTADSGDCDAGAGEFFELLDDGTLKYTIDYGDTIGVLHQTG